MLKAIIFDVGGVLIRTRSRAGREVWAAQLGLDSWEFENFVFSGESGRQAQLGQKSFEEHWQWLGRHFCLDEINLARMRQDFFAGDVLNKPLVEHVKRMSRAGYVTALLSNFADDSRTLWTEKFPFIQYFNEVIISCEVGMMKPDPRIYQLALERVEARPGESLFVDDFIENVEAARRVGMQALHFTNPQAAQQQLAEITGIE